ncbi:MAG TPA: peptide MFS transporter [Steroidobacteraceae bacterium]|nr:peptide MFS transporter [Steroidobacteraceae bacterium]
MTQDLNIPPGQFLGHPKGLYLLFFTEMWERFAYYGMRALLVLYAAAATHAANPGLGWAEPQALKLYGLYTGMTYLLPIFGGWCADNFLGQRKAVIIGGIVIALGQFTLAAPLDTMGTSGAWSAGWAGIAFPETPTSFYVGLLLLIVGNGFFKPNISTMVGDLYPQGDARRDGAFVIFYMGINLGAFLAPLVCSTLGEDPAYGWRVGFLAAGIGMTISVITQLAFAQRYIGDVGRVPAAKRSLAIAGGRKEPLTQVERDRLRVVFVIFVFVALFWASFEQAGGLMNLFADKHTDREVGSFLVPTGWFQSLNPLFILLLGLPFSMLWGRLGAQGRNPPAPVKMYLGLAQVALGFVFLVVAVLEMQRTGDVKSSMVWLVLAYLFHTTGELCISPVGLSMVTKLAPLRLGSLMMGVWFLVNFTGNLLAGFIGAFSANMGEYDWMVNLAASVGVRQEHAGLLGVFGGLAVVLILFSLVLWAISGKIVQWMHGAERTTT